jgi:hypothetical protein
VIAALYVERGGPYFTMSGVDPWDVERDAKRYAGPHPVVAHPPCGPWGALRHLYRGCEHACAPAALAVVRAWGGVLEHPARSLLWQHANLPRPGELPDAYGGFALEVDQVSWGHVARKKTWLYLVGIDRHTATGSVRTGGVPTHWISGFHSTGRSPERYAKTGSAVPPGIKVCSAQQRRRTPPAFAAWLVELARGVRP